MTQRDRILTHAIGRCFLEVHECRADVTALHNREAEIAFGIRADSREPRQVQIMRVRKEISNRFALLNAYEKRAESYAKEMFK